MSTPFFMLLFFLNVFEPTGALHNTLVLPPGSCFLDNNACEAHEDNLLMSVSGISTVEECRQICYDNQECEYITYFGHNSFPFTEVCMVFSNCSTVHPCPDCVTEDKFCYTTCSDNVEGPLGENIVETFPDVEGELDCKIKCSNDTDCKFYTYHNASDPNYPKLCILLTEIQIPLRRCSFCNTGTTECLTERFCAFMADENSSLVNTSLFTNTSKITAVHIVNVGKCKLKVLSIGGGGTGGDHSYDGKRFGGGGGSGEVSFVSFTPEQSSSLLVSVGSHDEPSSVVTEAGELILMAQPGAKGGDYDGGEGYSGGGGDGTGSVGYGGSNGSDGNAGSTGSGGNGSGLDISMFQLKTFNITPAETDKSPECGGGGGGVIINGIGAAINGDRGIGYGGGGQGCAKSPPSSGAIILEMEN